MSYNPPHRYSSTSAAGQGMFSSYQQAQQPPALVQRINDKKQELENLIQLRDLSAALAQQMEQLEQKLSTLADGTEAVAHVLANWQNVLRAISMASTPLTKLQKPTTEKDLFTEPSSEATAEGDEKTPLPITLVRIPTEHYQNIANPQ